MKWTSSQPHFAGFSILEGSFPVLQDNYWYILFFLKINLRYIKVSLCILRYVFLKIHKGYNVHEAKVKILLVQRIEEDM